MRSRAQRSTDNRGYWYVSPAWYSYSSSSFASIHWIFLPCVHYSDFLGDRIATSVTPDFQPDANGNPTSGLYNITLGSVVAANSSLGISTHGVLDSGKDVTQSWVEGVCTDLGILFPLGTSLVYAPQSHIDQIISAIPGAMTWDNACVDPDDAATVAQCASANLPASTWVLPCTPLIPNTTVTFEFGNTQFPMAYDTLL